MKTDDLQKQESIKDNNGQRTTVNKGRNLIFLISQPRAGSTMLQRILGSHPDIHTTSEPWVMLHPLYAMKQIGIETEYSSELARKTLNVFLSQIENGPAIYRDKIREMYGSLYEQILQKAGKKYFLDKTPRYYFIINELYELFPKAKFIVLYRNPLAVMSSIIESRINLNWYLFSRYKYDLLKAPDLMLNGLEQLGEAAICVKYEDILDNPENEIQKICDHIGVGFKNEMIEYGRNGMSKWRYGDQGTVYEKSKPDPLYAEKWIRSLENPQSWKCMREYLDYLGEERIRGMKYSYNELDATVNKFKPDLDLDRHSCSLFKFLDNTRDALIEVKRLRDELDQKDNQLKRILDSYSYIFIQLVLRPLKALKRNK